MVHCSRLSWVERRFFYTARRRCAGPYSPVPYRAGCDVKERYRCVCVFRRWGWSGVDPSRPNWPAVRSVATRSDCAQTAAAAAVLVVGRGRGRWPALDARWCCTGSSRACRTTCACWRSSVTARASRVRGCASGRRELSATPTTTSTCSSSPSTTSKVRQLRRHI